MEIIKEIFLANHAVSTLLFLFESFDIPFWNWIQHQRRVTFYAFVSCFWFSPQ